MRYHVLMHLSIVPPGTSVDLTHSTWWQALRQAKSGIYCSPLRLLAMEVYDQLNSDGLYCSLLTGACCWPGACSCSAHGRCILPHEMRAFCAAAASLCPLRCTHLDDSL